MNSRFLSRASFSFLSGLFYCSATQAATTVDNNTDLDLFVPNGSLYRNDETTGNWLKIALTDVDSNQSG